MLAFIVLDGFFAGDVVDVWFLCTITFLPLERSVKVCNWSNATFLLRHFTRLRNRFESCFMVRILYTNH